MTFSTNPNPLDTNLITICQLDKYFCLSVQRKQFPRRNRQVSQFIALARELSHGRRGEGGGGGDVSLRGQSERWEPRGPGQWRIYPRSHLYKE